MKNFFKSEQYTELFTENSEIWVFGDTPENINENTPRQFVSRDNSWGDGTEQEMELPVTDGHGTTEWVKGKIYIGEKHELLGTTAETNICRFFNFNV